MAKRETKPRQRRYKFEDGARLAIMKVTDGLRGLFVLFWDMPDGEFGATIGHFESDGDKPPTVKDDWEQWMIARAARPFVGELSPCDEFWFYTEKDARMALKAIHESLLSGAPWPDWAVKAKAAGWTPPEGWKP